MIRFLSNRAPEGNAISAGVRPVAECTDVLIIRCTIAKYLLHVRETRLS